jgi:hypothetical protein
MKITLLMMIAGLIAAAFGGFHHRDNSTAGALRTSVERTNLEREAVLNLIEKP